MGRTCPMGKTKWVPVNQVQHPSKLRERLVSKQSGFPDPYWANTSAKKCSQGGLLIPEGFTEKIWGPSGGGGWKTSSFFLSGLEFVMGSWVGY